MNDAPMQITPLIQLTGVTKEYASPGEPVRVLTGVDLTVERGARVAIVGPSGSGKSTLLNIIGALDTADSGEVSVNGREISGLDAASGARFRNREVGFIFQMHLLLPQCTVLENVLVPSLVAEDPVVRANAEEKAEMLLSSVGLTDRRDFFPGQLSGGERLRTAVVRSMINGPSVLLADEPTGSLDNETADTLADVLLTVSTKEGTTLIAVTHSDRLAGRFDTVYRLDNGTLAPCG